MGSIQEGAKQAVENCLKVKAGEKVVIITDRETLEIGSVIRETAERITKDIQFFVMEDFGERPLDFPEQIGEALKEADVSLYVAQGAKGELQTFRIPMLEVIKTSKRLRHGHMISITGQIMGDGMCSDYQKIQRISELVYQKVHKAKEIRVVTERGTDIIARFNPLLKWVISDGNIISGNWSNLPDGEVLTTPADINGTVVIDGCLGDFFTKKYGLLEKTPVTVSIKNGRAISGSIKCDNKELEQELTEYIFQTDENSNKVGEFALGTNVELKEIIGNLFQDEKFPGVHIAFGIGPLRFDTGADWDSKAHVDGVMKNTTVYVDGEMIMKKGKYLTMEVLGPTFEEGKPEGEELGKWRQKLETRKEKLRYLKTAERYWYGEGYGSEARKKPA